MKKVFFVIIVVVFVVNSILLAQRHTISGQLISRLTKSPVAYANILVEEISIGASSSPSGKFKLNVSTLPVTLTISHIGYEVKKVTVSTGNVGIIYLTPTVLMGEEVLVTSTRAIEGETPVAFSTFGREQIEKAYNHQDVPMVLSDLPGVYSYSDAGNGVGYSYLKIRGFPQDRIGVLLNGIPLNDPEAHAVYWVDHGDILAATGDIQLQRGVGNSLYGTSVFGGTVNMMTNFHSLYPGFTMTAGYGNYTDSGMNLPSRKMSFSYAGGPWRNKGISFYTRFSNLNSNGYRIGSGTQQRSFHAGAEKNDKNSMTRIEAIIGDEETAFSWEGIIPLYGYNLDNRKDRRYNFYADPTWNGGRNNANKDVFTQYIFSLQHTRKISDALINLVLYNVKGNGYYEQFKGESDSDDIVEFLHEYNLREVVLDTTQEVGLIRRKWLKNGYWGIVYQFSKPIAIGSVTLGGDTRLYRSKHFGKVVEIDGYWNVPKDHRYYFDKSNKTSFSCYVHSSFNLTKKLNLMADIRYLGHRYSFNQDVLGAFTEGYKYKLKYDFLDPHIGINYKINDNFSAFINLSTAHREPADADIYDHDDPEMIPAVVNMDAEYATPLTKEEFLIDYEAGLSFEIAMIKATLNLYRMDFRDELIPVWYRYYDADDVLHANAPRTIHKGIEFAFNTAPFKGLTFQGNVAYADNHFVEFFGDSIGWAGWGGVADYSNKVIPAYPAFQAKARLALKHGITESWVQLLYASKQYIDFANTDDAAIDPYAVVNIGTKINMPRFGLVKPILSLWVNNVFNTLYETFGYNYYDGWPPYRVDAYWPAATRNYYITLSLQL